MKTPQVQLIPIAQIRVVNPRVRDPKKFREIVESISQLGLKKPITVTPAAPGPAGEDRFDLVCGQGRLEACLAIGASAIPAMVVDFSPTVGLLASLVENIARRRVRPLEQVRLVQWMQAQGDDCGAIARTTGLSPEYVRDVIAMLEKGEERLLEGVLHGEIPISLAIRIASAPDEASQQLLLAAFDQKELTQKSLASFKRIIDHRRHFGRQSDRSPTNPAAVKSGADSLIQTYKRESQRLRLIVKKAKVCEARLLSVAAAFKVLLADDHYTTLLRAEQMDTMPKFLAERASKAA
jgi:ParB family chromosome partitioning protein